MLLGAVEAAVSTVEAVVAFTAVEAAASMAGAMAEADTTAAMAVGAIVAAQAPTVVAVPTEETCAPGRPRPGLRTMRGHRKAMEFVIHPLGGIPSNHPPTVARWPGGLVRKGLDGLEHRPAQPTIQQTPMPLSLTDNGMGSAPGTRVQP